ncbi:glycosyltransferase family 9 protein [Erwinia sp. AnSW2-5]|uniref:glycosyltransferase family 9 protein n=1 Tax=Erwinia sp. AnSW2-5 TaxID=3367692 RepID=UPI00385FC035
MRESKKFKIGLSNFLLGLVCPQAKKNVEKQKKLRDIEFSSIFVYSTTALGDYMFNSPAIRAIRLRYPHAEITLVAHPKYQKLLTRRDDYDDVIFWTNKVSDMAHLVRLAKRKKPQLAVLLHSHMPYDIVSAALMGCQYIVRDNYAKPLGSMERWVTYGLDYFDEHVIARKMKLVSALGCAIDHVDMVLPCEPQPVEKIEGRQRVGFQLGASSRIRCWPPEYYAQLAECLIANNPNVEIILIGSAEEVHLAESFMVNIDASATGNITSYVGRTTLPQLLGVIGSMDLLVTGDTGPFHLAIALKIPTLSLFVTEDPRRSGPYQDKHIHQQIYLPLTDAKVTDKNEPLRAISTDYVYQMVNKMLKA